MAFVFQIPQAMKKLSPKMQAAAAAACALALTCLIAWVDAYRLDFYQTSLGLRLGRQLTQSLDGLTLAARNHGEEDPLGWAVTALNQGVEPRSVRISKFNGQMAERLEAGTYNSADGVFDFSKLLIPEEGTGVKIRIALGYAGFLGTRTRLANDLLFLFVFALWTAGFTLALRLRLSPNADPRLRLTVMDWLRGSRTQLLQLGGYVRDLVREANNLAQAAAKSRQALSGLRERIHDHLREIHQGRRDLREAVSTCQQAEAGALNLIIEASRLGENGDRVSRMAEDLLKSLQRARKAGQRCELAVAEVERQMEPWATDADLAFHAYEDVFKATEGMDGHIRRTTESLLGHARMIQDCAVKVEEEPDATAPAQQPDPAPQAEPVLEASPKKRRSRSKKAAA